MRLILGSSSKPRQKILADMGYEFEVMSPEVDEKAIRDPDPKKLVLLVARAKADDIAKRAGNSAIIITGDSVAIVKGEIREKPKDKEQAYAWIREIAAGVPQGQACAMVVTNTKTGERFEGIAESCAVFGSIPEEDIAAFVESGAVFNLAGAFAIQDPPFVHALVSLEGEMDTMSGLPKKLTEKLLKQAGHQP